MKLKKLKKAVAIMAASVMVLGLAACSSGGNNNDSATDAPATGETQGSTEVEADGDYTITILTVSHSGELITEDHPAIQQLEELTGYNIKLEFVLNANFEEQMNLRLASGDLPGIVVLTGNNQSIVQAAKGGAFWDLTDHLADFEYLNDLNPIIMNNISIDGRAYGIYRERPVGRPGMVYRADWLEDLGLDVPETLDDFYASLIAMTENNPEPNGGNTFGMAWTGGHMGPFHDLAVMHGAPNRFEVVDGEFVPWFEHEGFTQAMEESKKLFEAGAINADFAALATSDWAPLMGAGLSGWHLDVADEARRTANRLRDNEFFTQEELDADNGEILWVVGAMANAAGETRVRAHAGHAGYVAVSTSGAKTEEDLMHHLNFLNMLNSAEGQNILSWGARGYNWEEVDGAIRIFTEDEVEEAHKIVEGLNQFYMRNNLGMVQYGVNPREQRQTEVIEDNLQYAINDPTLPLVSDTWVQHSVTLNRLIDDAVINFILGNIDMAGFDLEVARWYSEGGQTALEEFAEAYAQAN